MAIAVIQHKHLQALNGQLMQGKTQYTNCNIKRCILILFPAGMTPFSTPEFSLLDLLYWTQILRRLQSDLRNYLMGAEYGSHHTDPQSTVELLQKAAGIISWRIDKSMHAMRAHSLLFKSKLNFWQQYASVLPNISLQHSTDMHSVSFRALFELAK